MSLNFMYITNSPTVAEIAENAGVESIFVDLEKLGKEERQRGLDSVKSNHSVQDIIGLRKVLTKSKLLVRVDPIHERSEQQIEAVVSAGADIIMLPMWKTVEEVQQFLDYVNHRCKTMLLLETKEADQCLDEVVRLSGIDAVHIGLNDLHLSYRRTFMFELLSDGTVERICSRLQRAGMIYGFGGVGRVGEGMLPAEHILGEHIRLESSMVILSRSFCNTAKVFSVSEIERSFREGIRDLREREAWYRAQPQAELEKNHRVVCSEVADIVARLNEKKG